MAQLGIGSLEQLARQTGMDRGTLHRYFALEQEPGARAIQPLCEALEVEAEILLRLLGYWI